MLQRQRKSNARRAAAKRFQFKLSHLLDAHQIIIRQARILARRASTLGDDGTNDLVVSEVLRTNELQAWFLSEHQVNVPLVKAQSSAGL